MTLTAKNPNSDNNNCSSVDWTTLDWQAELSNNITSVAQLKKHIPLSTNEETALEEVVGVHPMNIPRYYLSLVNGTDPEDPIRKLSIPGAEELIVAGAMGETTKDPYGDDGTVSAKEWSDCRTTRPLKISRPQQNTLPAIRKFPMSSYPEATRSCCLRT